MIEDDKVDAIVALPDKLFYSTGIPVCLWILAQNKSHEKQRERKGETLFIDARNLGEMVTRKHRELSDEEIKTIADTYHDYRNLDGEYEDIKGFCKKANLEEIQKHDYVLTPGRYVGIATEEDDGVPFEEKMTTLSAELKEQFEKSKNPIGNSQDGDSNNSQNTVRRPTSTNQEQNRRRTNPTSKRAQRKRNHANRTKEN